MELVKKVSWGGIFVMLEVDWVSFKCFFVWNVKKNKSKGKLKGIVVLIREFEESLFWVVFCNWEKKNWGCEWEVDG